VVYAGLFVCVDLAYNVFEHYVLARADTMRVSARIRRMAKLRSLCVLAGFTTAMLLAYIVPGVGFGMICAALLLHLSLEATPGNRLSQLAIDRVGFTFVYLTAWTFVAAHCQSKADPAPEAQGR